MATLTEEFQRRIECARSLPSPPVVTVELIRLCEDPTTGIREIIDLLSTDAALTARLLRLANSPIYARRRRTENLRQAVMLLGVDAALTASLSLTLVTKHQTDTSVPLEFLERHWTRSVHSAAIAQILAESVVGVKPSDAFLAGLLQDLGVQVVVRLEPSTYESLDGDSSHDDLVRTELDRLGFDHAVIGADLLGSWKLPERVVDAVRASHHLGGPGTTELSNLIAIASVVAEGVAGHDGALIRAAAAARAELGIDEQTFSAMLEHLAVTLPDLALILKADVPDPEMLIEMAEEVMVARSINTQRASAELHDRVVALTNANEELKVENRLDPLTGLSNRRELDDVLEREFLLASDHAIPLSVLFVDLDDFKIVNDRFGHTVGDLVLVQAARRVSACVRDGDLVGRFGGEELIVVLPGADVANAEAVAQRLVDRFDAQPFEIDADITVVQTVSVGVATFDAQHRYVDVDALVHAADVALYAAKSRGKNQWLKIEGDEITEGRSLRSRSRTGS